MTPHPVVPHLCDSEPFRTLSVVVCPDGGSQHSGSVRLYHGPRALSLSLALVRSLTWRIRLLSLAAMGECIDTQFIGVLEHTHKHVMGEDTTEDDYDAERAEWSPELWAHTGSGLRVSPHATCRRL